MTIFAISGMINAICVFTLGCVVYFNDRKKAINKQYALFCLCVGIWSLCYCFWQAAYDKSIALFWVRGLMAGATFIPVLFLHFVLLLLGRYEKQKRIVGIGYFIFFLFFLSDFTPLFISDVRPKMVFRFWPDAGPIFGFFLLIWLSYCIYPCYLLIKDYKNFSGIKQQQVKYVLIGILIGYISGSTNYFLWYNIPVLPLGNFTVPLFVGMMAYAVIRHRLMDINVFAIRVSLFIIVYIIVLGIPIVLATLGRSWLGGLGDNWHLYLLLFGMALASVGPFIFLYLQRRTENALLRRQRSYQNALLSLSKRMTRLRSTAELFEATGTTIVDTVKAAYVGIYLKDEERNAFKVQFSHPKKDKSRFEEFLPIDHSIIKLLSERKKPLLTSEVAASVDRHELYFSLIVPCFMEDELLSFIVLGSKPNREMYAGDDIVVFETLSYSMALSIENCFFWEDVENRQRQARLEELDAFSYSVAHEIHNPMTVINGNATLLLNLLKKLNMPEEKFQDVTLFLNHIIACSDRVSKMVEAIHQFGQKTTGEFGPLDIRDAVEIFSEAHAPELKYKGVAFVKEIPDEPIFIRGEQGELMMVFNNFYKNSLHALQAAPIKKITIKIEKITSDRVRVSFTDTGYGIEKSKLPIIFTQFVTTKASTEGSGMGLYVVKSVVNRHKGKIWAESEGKDRGATVTLELPILKDVKETKVKEDIKSKWKF